MNEVRIATEDLKEQNWFQVSDILNKQKNKFL